MTNQPTDRLIWGLLGKLDFQKNTTEIVEHVVLGYLADKVGYRIVSMMAVICMGVCLIGFNFLPPSEEYFSTRFLFDKIWLAMQTELNGEYKSKRNLLSF